LKIKKIHPDFILPKRSSELAGGYDIYMPESGYLFDDTPLTVGLGFATKVPDGHVAIILPRSGTGSKYGIGVRNTAGVIDSDFIGEWKATLVIDKGEYSWNKFDRLLQFIIVPVYTEALELVEELDETVRGIGGYGSTGV